MNNIVIAVILIIIFFTGVISPRAAGKIQRKTNQKASWLKSLSNWFWDPITWWLKKSIEWTRKIIDWVAQGGKKVHDKVPIDDPKANKSAKKKKSTRS